MDGKWVGNADSGGEPADRDELCAALKRALGEKVLMYDGGKKRKVTKLKAILTTIVRRAASGNKRALDRLMPLLLSPSFAQVRATKRTYTTEELEAEISQIFFGLPADRGMNRT